MKNKIEFIRKGTIIILSKLVLNSNSCVSDGRRLVSLYVPLVLYCMHTHTHPPTHTHNCHLHVHQDKQ